MKNVAFLFLIIFCFFLQSCENIIYHSKLYFENKTDLTIKVSHYDSYFEPFTIQPNEFKIVKSKHNFAFALDLEHTETDKVITSENIENNKIVLVEYDHMFSYKISGTAKSVFVTMNDNKDNTVQFSDVALPAEYGFKERYTDFLYISAQNEGEKGSVTVEIWYKNKLLKSATSSGSYVIATASSYFD